MIILGKMCILWGIEDYQLFWGTGDFLDKSLLLLGIGDYLLFWGPEEYVGNK